MRKLLLFSLLLTATVGYGQLQLGGGAGATVLNPEGPLLSSWPRTGGPAPMVRPQQTPQPLGFDFAQTRPHLAFFCRLELNIEKATRFPAKFRLGEVRSWQQELGRRD